MISSAVQSVPTSKMTKEVSYERNHKQQKFTWIRDIRDSIYVQAVYEKLKAALMHAPVLEHSVAISSIISSQRVYTDAISCGVREILDQ